MIIEALSLPLLYDLAKTLMGFGSIAVGAYKVVQWVKAIREKDLTNLQTGITAVHEGLEKQTTALVAELKEQRQDFRTFYGPLLQAVALPIAPRARARRVPRPKARKPVTRKALKKK